MAWCVECWSDGRRTIPATKVLDAEDLCDLHYRKALGPGLPAKPANAVPPPAASAPHKAAVAPAETQPAKPAPEAVNDKKSSAPPEAAKEKEAMAPRLCACGCGEATKSNASPYMRGHNPNKKTTTASAGNGKEKTGVRLTPRKIRGGQESNGSEATVSVPLHVSHLDALWARLSLQEKADKLFPAE